MVWLNYDICSQSGVACVSMCIMEKVWITRAFAAFANFSRSSWTTPAPQLDDGPLSPCLSQGSTQSNLLYHRRTAVTIGARGTGGRPGAPVAIGPTACLSLACCIHIIPSPRVSNHHTPAVSAFPRHQLWRSDRFGATSQPCRKWITRLWGKLGSVRT